MEKNIHETIQEQQPISDFISMPQEKLNFLIPQWHLHMTARDLRYCQNQYRMRERRNPTVEELQMLDALYFHRIRRCETHGLRTFYTSDPVIAQSYADMLAKASHTHREDRPYTPAELSGVLTKSLQQAGKKITVPTLCTGTDASIRLLKKSLQTEASIVIDGVPAVIGYSEQAFSKSVSHPQLTDHLILISPAGLSSATFAEIAATLSIPDNAQLIFVGERGLLDALLTWDGVYIVQNYLPSITNNAPLSAWVNAFADSLIIRCDGDHAVKLRDEAAALGLTASIIGKYALNNRVTIRRNGQAPVQIETAFLRAFSPTFPTDVEIPGLCTSKDAPHSAPERQTIINGGDSLPFSSAIPGTAYAVSRKHLITGAASYSASNTFRAALYTTVYAINRAVAAGIDHDEITLSNHLKMPSLPDRNAAMSEIMSAMLGAYRVQAELAIPDIGGAMQAAEDQTPKAQLTVFAAAPKPEKTIPTQFTATGSNVYLLAPLSSQDSPIDFEDYRKLLRYVHRLCKDGIALSAIAVGSGGIEEAIRTMTQSGLGFYASAPLPDSTCAFLIETKQQIQGVMLGITTASPFIRIEGNETPIVDYSMPYIHPDHLPMSDIGVEHPILCVPQTTALGSLNPFRDFAECHHLTLTTPLLNRLKSRSQLTAFANILMQSNIALLTGSTDDIHSILSNPRVAYAKQEMLQKGGLFLCLHTDLSTVKNEHIPPDHPLFFGVPKSLYERSAISFEGDDHRIVHMRSDSPAVRAMLTCGIAYFR